jgi:tRNA G10  N-methylase Trm11
MKYAFILGRHPALSLAELVKAVPNLTIGSVVAGVAIGEADKINPSLINQLGGTIKIAEISSATDKIANVNQTMLERAIPPREGRIIFGISIYGHVSGFERRGVYIEGLNLKKRIKESGKRCRYVVSQDTQLSSVVVQKNKLIEEGAEIIIIKEKNTVLIGRTLSIQSFEAYGERDFDRPGRSARRGMLPPKLAQMMINIAGGDKTKTLLDPFCGSGTVLGEALLLGYTDIIGSDISAQAVADSRAYLEWLEISYPEFKGRWRLFVSDARQIGAILPAETVATIVTEPFLGAPQNGRETPEQLQKIMTSELAPLYRDSLLSLYKILSAGANAVFSFPVYNKSREPIYVKLDEISGGLVAAPIVPDDYSFLSLPTTPSGGALYERPDQFVGREIILLKK